MRHGPCGPGGLATTRASLIGSTDSAWHIRRRHPLMGQEHRQRHVFQNGPADAAEQQFLEPRVAVTAHHQQAGAACGGQGQQALADVAGRGRGAGHRRSRLQHDDRIEFTDPRGCETGFSLARAGRKAFIDAEQCCLTSTTEGRYVMVDLSDVCHDFRILDIGGNDVAPVRPVVDRAGQWHRCDRNDRQPQRSTLRGTSHTCTSSTLTWSVPLWS